jgi:hypothetical protein
MVLLDHIIQKLISSYFDPFANIIIILLYGCSIGATFIDIDQAWLTVATYGFGKKPYVAFMSRFAVNRKSMVSQSLSTAR